MVLVVLLVVMGLDAWAFESRAAPNWQKGECGTAGEAGTVDLW